LILTPCHPQRAERTATGTYRYRYRHPIGNLEKCRLSAVAAEAEERLAKSRLPFDLPYSDRRSFHAWRFHNAETGMAASFLPKGTMSLPV
jgi:hypothetical protein